MVMAIFWWWVLRWKNVPHMLKGAGPPSNRKNWKTLHWTWTGDTMSWSSKVLCAKCGYPVQGPRNVSFNFHHEKENSKLSNFNIFSDGKNNGNIIASTTCTGCDGLREKMGELWLERAIHLIWLLEIIILKG